jgi:hypothetical protein
MRPAGHCGVCVLLASSFARSRRERRRSSSTGHDLAEVLASTRFGELHLLVALAP